MSPQTPTIVPAKKVKQLGAARGRSYIEHNGREYLLRRGDASSDLGRQVPGEIVVTSVEETIDEAGYKSRRQVNVRAEPVERGTFEALRNQVKPKATREQPLRPRDELERLAVFAHREPTRIVTGSPSEAKNPLYARLYSDMRKVLGGPEPTVIEVGSEPPPRSAEAIIELLKRHGVLLSLAPRTGQLLARSRKPIGMVDREVIDVAEPLLVDALGGAKALCAVCGEQAVSIYFPRTLLCARHAAD